MSNGQLHVRSSLADEQDPFAKVSGVFVCTMRWRRFVMTRWLTLGASCRALLRSLCLGISDLMSFVRSDPKVSDYHAHGYERLGDAEVFYVVVAALAVYPMESFLGNVMEDDRLARNLDEVVSDLDDEMQYLQQIPESAWVRLAGVLEEPVWGRLRSAVLVSAHISYAYLSKKSIGPASAYPWSLCRGDLRQNLIALKEVDLPRDIDPATKRVQMMVRMGFPEAQLLDVCRLIAEVGWSTKAVEEAHGQAAVVHRLHPDLGAAGLPTRAFLGTSRALWQQPPEERSRQRIEAKRKRLAGNRGRAVSGRNMFYAKSVAPA